jgi:hypothetical protein
MYHETLFMEVLAYSVAVLSFLTAVVKLVAEVIKFNNHQ